MDFIDTTNLQKTLTYMGFAMCLVLRDTSYWQTPLPPICQLNMSDIDDGQ